jgi:hypothetical protein
MSETDCLHEEDVEEAVLSGRWPAGCDADLVAHAMSCVICSDVIAVAGAICEAGSQACAEARIPPAGLMWWRAQLRARHDVAESVGRPITCIHAVAGAVAAGLFFTLGGLLWPWLRASIEWIDAVSRTAEIGSFWVPIGLAIGAWLVLAPVVMLIVLSDD